MCGYALCDMARLRNLYLHALIEDLSIMQIYKGFRVEMGESYIVRSRYCESIRFNGNQRLIFILQHFKYLLKHTLMALVIKR